MKKVITAKVHALTVKEAFDEFIMICKTKELAEASISHYKYCFLRFSKFMDVNSTLTNIEKNTIVCFIHHMKDNGLQASSININLGGIRSFLYYCIAQQYLLEFKINLVKTTEKIQPTYSEEDLLKLLEKPKSEKFNDIRNWCIISFAVATGARVTTISSTNIEDISLINKTVTIKQQKNRKVKILPIGDSLVQILKSYLITYLSDAEKDSPLFPSCFGARMRATSMEQVIRIHNRKHGVDTTAMHAFRRTYAKLFILNHGSIEHLKELMCHSSVTQTEKYFKLYADDLRQDYERYNPLEQLLAQNKKGTYIKAKT